MADIYNGRLTNQWVDASTLATFTEGNDYLIQNQGSDFLVAAVAASEPNDNEGTIVPNLMQAHYKADSNTLYLKAFSRECVINISEIAAE